MGSLNSVVGSARQASASMGANVGANLGANGLRVVFIGILQQTGADDIASTGESKGDYANTDKPKDRMSA